MKSHALTSVKGLWDKMRWLGDSDDVYPALATGRVGPETACSRARSRLDCRKFSRFSSDDYPRYPDGLARKNLVCQRPAWRQLARGHKQANPGAQLRVIHASWTARKGPPGQPAILMHGWAVPTAGPAGVSPPDVEMALQVLTAHGHHEIPDVTLTPGLIREHGL